MSEVSNKAGRPKKEVRECICGYAPLQMCNLKRHKAVCRVVREHDEESRVALLEAREQDRITSLEQQLSTKDQQMKEQQEMMKEQLAAKDQQLVAKDQQLATKDKQIEQLLKRPRTSVTTHNTQLVVNSNVNCFGKETVDHISDETFRELLKHPDTSIAKVVALQRSIPENMNVVIPNVRERRWLVVTEEAGEKKWRSMEKHEVLQEMWDNGSFLLEGIADEEVASDMRWIRWLDKLRGSQDENGKLYRDQIDLVENSILDQRADEKASAIGL